MVVFLIFQCIGVLLPNRPILDAYNNGARHGASHNRAMLLAILARDYRANTARKYLCHKQLQRRSQCSFYHFHQFAIFFEPVGAQISVEVLVLFL
jgi:hypothetical protein